MKIVIPLIFDKADSFFEGIAGVRKNNKWGFIDRNGKVVVPFQYE